MANALIKAIIRTRFVLTSRTMARVQAENTLRLYLQLAAGISDVEDRKPVSVPPMMGVDEKMRNWSFFMLLRHNTIVNHAISANVRRLVLCEPEPIRKFNPKTDVIPENDCGIEQIVLFKSSVLAHLAHLESLDCLGALRGTETTNHPLFGQFDAHKWNCMFTFHLRIHLKQAEFIRRGVS
jgi:hypothetical protein